MLSLGKRKDLKSSCFKTRCVKVCINLSFWNNNYEPGKRMSEMIEMISKDNKIITEIVTRGGLKSEYLKEMEKARKGLIEQAERLSGFTSI